MGKDVENWNPHALEWDVKHTSDVENSLTVTQKVKHSSIGPSNSAHTYIPKRIENLDLHKKWNTNVHNSIIHNSQRLKYLFFCEVSVQFFAHFCCFGNRCS